MSIDSFGFNEHFDYMKNCIPQPFLIKSDDVVSLEYDSDLQDYVIKTKRFKYTVARGVLKKLVDALGVKVKLLAAAADDEADVIDLVLPAVNKLFKCFADCFVFYSRSDDNLTIIDLNVNAVKGEEGTKYENGPSPWKIDVNKSPSSFTCFADFKGKFCIDDNDSNILVKADDILSNKVLVIMNLFKVVPDSLLQPMLTMCSKFSNMNGFTEIHPMLYDTMTNIEITFPMNYGNAHADTPFETLWGKALHVLESTDLNDYIFREISELEASDDTPTSVKNFISSILIDSIINVNQPIRAILDEAVTVSAQMKAGKKKKFLKQLGGLIGWCICMKHRGCESCGHIHI